MQGSPETRLPSQVPEKALSSELSRELLDASPAVHFAIHPDGKMGFVSRAVESIYGVKPEKVMAGEFKLQDAIHPDDQARVETEMAKLQKGENVEIIYRIQKPDRKERWVCENCRVNEKGDVIGSIVDVNNALYKGLKIGVSTSRQYFNDIFTSIISSVQLSQMFGEKFDSDAVIAESNRGAKVLKDFKKMVDSGKLEILETEVSEDILDLGISGKKNSETK